MSILYDPHKLRHAAKALLDIDQACLIRELGDAIMLARREHKRQELDHAIGHGIYIDQLATVLARTAGNPIKQ